ncbi:MAG: DUF1318 domain-containing protein [Alphaproteobacteria bacterium]|nr:MAG: DUF1318 domain-containing protein [Alphaproteobacteria bacterium]
MKSGFQKIVFAAAALLMSASVAFAALSVDAAKSEGLVGEQPNGLLGIVTAAPSPDVQTLVSQTNAERLKRYQDIATKNGTQVEQVQAVAGEKLVSTTPAGQYIMTASGTWQKK